MWTKTSASWILGTVGASVDSNAVAPAVRIPQEAGSFVARTQYVLEPEPNLLTPFTARFSASAALESPNGFNRVDSFLMGVGIVTIISNSTIPSTGIGLSGGFSLLMRDSVRRETGNPVPDSRP